MVDLSCETCEKLSSAMASGSTNINGYFEAIASRELTLFGRLLSKASCDPSRQTVHELRICGRKLLLILKLSQRWIEAEEFKSIHKTVKRTVKSLGKLRDLQVQSDKLSKLKKNRIASGPFCSALNSKAINLKGKVKRRLTDKKLRKTLSDLSELKNHLRSQLKSRAKAVFVQDSLRIERKRLLAQIRTAQNSLQPDSLNSMHDLREELRKYRYFCELFAPVLRDIGPGTVVSLNQLHSMLGNIQDLRVLRDRVQKFGKRNKIRSDKGLPQYVTRNLQALKSEFFYSGKRLLNTLH